MGRWSRKGAVKLHPAHGEQGNHQKSEESPGFADGLEAMEQRTLMSALTYEQFAERFNIPNLIHDIQRPDGGEYVGFGYAGVGLGDINGDGINDFAISAPGSAFGDENLVEGAVFIFSGGDGALIRTLADGSAGFGFALANIGDVDGDGINDLLVGSPLYDGNGDDVAERFGRAWIYSGADGTEIRFFDGVGAADEFGYALAVIGDINSDGINDFAVGAPGAGGAAEGQVMVYSGGDGAVIYTFTGEATGQRFGAAVIAPGDFGAALGEGGDGFGEIFIGAPGSDAAPDFEGRVYLYDGATGALRWTSDGEYAGDRFGAALGVSFIAPNHAILYVGTPGYDIPNGDSTIENAGYVYRFNHDGTSTQDHAILSGAVANERFGERITWLGDIDGDGADDIGIMSPGAAEGQRIRIYSGNSPVALQFLLPPGVLDQMGDTIFGIGDVDNDGFADVGSNFGAGDRFTVTSSLAIVPPAVIEIASDNLQYFFTNTSGGRAFAIIDNRIVSFEKVAGLLSTDRVLGVNNEGDIVVRSEVQGAAGFYIIRGGNRVRLQDLLDAAPTDPAPDFSAFQFVRIGNGGDVLFMDSADQGDEGTVTRSWLLRGTTLSFLWNGEVRDVNASGQILGVRHTAQGSVVVLRSADGMSEETIELSDASRVNDNGLVVGVNADGDLATWLDGDITVIGDLELPEDADRAEWVVLGLNNDGRVLAAYRTFAEGSSTVLGTTDYLFVPGEGLSNLYDITFDIDAGEDPRNDRAVALGADGTIISRSGAFTVVANNAPWVGQDGTPLWASGGALVIAGINQFGDAILLRRVGDTWRGARIDIEGLMAFDSFTIDQILTLTDASGATYVFLLTSQGGFAARHTGDAATVAALRLDGGEGSTQIVDHATVFASTDGRVHLAGTDANGHLIIYYENDHAGAAGQFSYDNLTTNHVEQQGLTFHEVASNLVVLTTAWGASHLFYLNDAGELFSVWIAPGMELWTSTNISDSLAGGTAKDNPERLLSGEITAYYTPWGGLNVAGANPDGDPTAIWWVPGFGSTWRHDKIYSGEGEGPIAFNPDATTSYTTPWGGLNIASIQEDGEIAVFWWVPGFSEWRAEILDIGERPEGLTFSGDITATVTGDTLNIFARGSDGDLYRLFWNPGDESTWNLENVTESVA